MNLALWIVTGLLATVMLIGGATKLFVPKEKLAATAHGDGPTTSASASSKPSEPSNSWRRWESFCLPWSVSRR